MPFGGIDRPAIGISTLKAGLATRGIACDIRYLNFVFAEMSGPSLYQWFADKASHMIFAGEWLFAADFFGGQLPSSRGYFDYLRRRSVDPQAISVIESLRPLPSVFLNQCMTSVDWGSYDVIGFTSTFEQNLASLALAHRVKSQYPDKVIVMGGANCEGSMGLALHRHFPYLDYVFTGASDHSFPEFVSRLEAGQSIGDIPGIAFRQGQESISTGASRGVEDLNTIPVPDYDDYFEQIGQTSIRKTLPIRLQIETSRGCWWGMKQHCTFCGMNAATMRFGSKSGERVLSEIEGMVRRYGVRSFDAVDAIMDMDYFRGLLPELRDRQLGLDIFYEIKANLSKPQVRLLAESGVIFIQPGIESFSTRVLRIMRKGATALQNLQLLKWCKQYGVEATWNLLYGFPGENAADYTAQVRLLEKLFHLTPPRGSGRLRMDRFSPHFERRNDFGFVRVRPLEAYQYIYPLPESAIFDIGYFFDYEHGDGLDPSVYIGETEDTLEAWRQAAARGAILRAFQDSSGCLRIDDTRAPESRRWSFHDWQAGVYLYCDQARPRQSVFRFVAEQFGSGISPREVNDFLATTCAEALMTEDEGWFLSLAVHSPSLAQLLESRSEPTAASLPILVSINASV
jgi:ribosomal peptide maturation radical SAM protein 1